LFGFLSTLHLLGRKKTLKIYAPQGLQEIVELYIRTSNPEIIYQIEFCTLQGKGTDLIYEDPHLTIHSFPMDHRIECYGFVFRQKQQLPRIRKEAIEKYAIPIGERAGIKRGNSFTFEGKVIPHDELCEPPDEPCMYAYCSDTKYNESILPGISNATLLYHEATFMNDMQEVAHQKYHSTTLEAATMAKKANAKQLIIGHFSARYEDAELLVNEARTVFPDTYLAEEGKKYNISNYDSNRG
jgi:ribonuclease Z